MKTTIIIPERRHPNFLELCLESLIRNSHYKHDIIVVGSNIEEHASDFVYNKDKKRYKQYYNLKEFLTARKDWLEENNITYIDVTEQRAKLKAKYERERGVYQDGVDTAFKDNIGAMHVKTKWFFWNWDDDFIAAPDWDVNLLKYVDNSKHDRVYIPTHVQPIIGVNDPTIMVIDFEDSWNTSSHIAINRLALAITSRTTREDYLLESELNAFCAANKREGIYVEKCGIRRKTHWVPMLIERDLYLRLGGCNLQGPGYDIAFDDMLGKEGMTRVMSRSSFFVHKGYVIWGDGPRSKETGH